MRGTKLSGFARSYPSSPKIVTRSFCLFQIWDEELARVAQKHADQCVFQHDCADCRKIRESATCPYFYKTSATYPNPQTTFDYRSVKFDNFGSGIFGKFKLLTFVRISD